jgi:hypothetical protein
MAVVLPWYCMRALSDAERCAVFPTFVDLIDLKLLFILYLAVFMGYVGPPAGPQGGV